jgi:hypothetical protein
MTKAIKPPAAIGETDEHSPACENPAVALCCDAWELAFQEEMDESGDNFDARELAHKAYRNAMPPLSGYQCICDFIACAAHGMLIDAIEEKKGTRLLYAAQVALSTIRSQQKGSPHPPRTPLCSAVKL